MSPIRWPGCYDESWRGVIVDAAFAHPAKMARGLLRRIYDELERWGALRPGATVLDPFGGTGTTGLEAALRGYRGVSVELEPKFVKFARQTYATHRRALETMDRPLPVMLQGDSRRLRRVLSEASRIDAIIASPPYAGNAKADYLMSEDGKTRARDERRGYRQGAGSFRGSESAYGDSGPQLGRMPSGDIDAVISSPPYAEIASGAGGLNTRPAKHAGQQGGRAAESPSQATDQRYGSSDGQLARLKAGDVDAVVASPPYPQPYSSGGGINTSGYGGGTDKVGARTYQGVGGDRAVGNLETLPNGTVDAIVSSPPYEGSFAGTDNQHHTTGKTMQAARAGRRSQDQKYAGSKDNVGNATGETFWAAAKQIVAESYAILPPGGYAVWVVKAFVRDGTVQDFPGDWRRLCEHVGFEVVQEVHASLVTETRRPDLFDGEIVRRTARKSFFRRLYEAKHPENAIDHETVWFIRKPCGAARTDSQTRHDEPHDAPLDVADVPRTF